MTDAITNASDPEDIFSAALSADDDQYIDDLLDDLGYGQTTSVRRNAVAQAQALESADAIQVDFDTQSVSKPNPCSSSETTTAADSRI